MKLLVSLAGPSAFALLTTTLFSVTEAAVIGYRCEPGALSLLALYFPLHTLVMALASGIGVGAASVISRRLGAGEPEAASRAASAAFGLSLLVGALFAMVSLAFPEGILFLSGGVPEDALLAQQSAAYIRVMGVSLFFFPATVVTLNLMRSEGAHKSAAGMLFLGLGLNLILLFSEVWIGGGGLLAAAAASAAGRVVSFLLALGYFRLHTRRLHLNLKDLIPESGLFWEMARIGVSAVVLGGANVLTALFLNWLLGWKGGEDAVSMLAVVYRTISLVLLPSFAVIQGVQPIVGFYHGAGRRKSLRHVLVFGALFSCLITFLLILPGFLMPQNMVRLFSDQPQLIASADLVLRPVLISALFLSIYNLSAAFYQSVGKALPAFFYNVLRQLILFIPMAILFVAMGGVDGLWMAFPAADATALGIILLIFLWRLYRRRRSHVPVHSD